MDLSLPPAFMRAVGEPDERSRSRKHTALSNGEDGHRGRALASFPLWDELQVDSFDADTRRRTADRTATIGRSMPSPLRHRQDKRKG